MFGARKLTVIKIHSLTKRV